MNWSIQQVAGHNNPNSCWVIIHNNVYDVTNFLSEHPGGAKVILEYAGRDATAAYDPVHPPDALDVNLPSSKHLGPLDAHGIRKLTAERENRKQSKDEARVEKAQKMKLPLRRMLSLADIEEVARSVLPYKALAYYSSASDDEITNAENARAFSRFFFHARVMRLVSRCDPSTTILGFKSSIPVFVSAAALAKLGHPLGEVNITIGAGKSSIIQMVSSNASLSPSEIAGAASPDQPLFFQLYKHSDARAAQRVREVERLGYKAIWLTVDAIVTGNRERDIRAPWVEEESSKEGGDNSRGAEDLEEATEMVGTAGALVANVDREMTWMKTIPWLRSLTKLPIVVKGIQCIEDCIMAVDAGVDGILISNHGGRQLDYSMPPIEILYKLRKQRPDIFGKTEVYIDGGVRRGTDVLKALCLGAQAVGLGRPFLYAQSAYGSAGVVKLVRILEREIITGMRLLGASSIADLQPEMVERVDWLPVVRAARL